MLDRLTYPGIEIKRLPLQQALTEGLIEIEIKGMGLTQVSIKIKPKIDINMEIEIQPGTTFIAGTEGVQNMVVRERELVYIKPQAEVSLEVEASCANMYLKQPSFNDTFTISQEPANNDLVQLFSLEDFYYEPLDLQQFAVWTITDNPSGTYDYVAIDFGGYPQYPSAETIGVIRGLFENAGIDTTKFQIFNN